MSLHTQIPLAQKEQEPMLVEVGALLVEVEALLVEVEALLVGEPSPQEEEAHMACI